MAQTSVQKQFFQEPEVQPLNELMFKIVLIGDSGVGKSQLLLRYTKNQFKNKAQSTIGMEFATQQVTIKDGVTVRAQIWDTAGQERYRAITNAYYRQAIGVLLVYDISRRQSFESLDRWINEVREHADNKIQIILVGNKNDLQNNRQISQSEGQQFAQNQGIEFVESSALTSNNVDTAFIKLISQINDKVQSGYYQDRLETFNYFGSAKIRQLYMNNQTSSVTGLESAVSNGETYQLKNKDNNVNQNSQNNTRISLLNEKEKEEQTPGMVEGCCMR